MKDLVRKDVQEMKPYTEEPQGGLNLMSNTNLFGVNPAIERGLAKIRHSMLSEYPSLTSLTLRQAVAKRHGLLEDQVVTGNGSNELIDVLMRTVCEPGDTVAFHMPTFSMVPVFARANHARTTPVPLTDGWQLDVDGLLQARAKMTFLVQPNNPTGNAFPRRDVARVVREAEGVVVVDEAYVEFMEDAERESFVNELRDGADRLIVLRTLSKAYGLAGLRAGFALTSPALAEQVSKIRGPFRLNSVSETVASIALSDDTFVQETAGAVRAERPNLQRMLEERGFFVYPSDANFLLARAPVDAQKLAEALGARGIWVREFGGGLAPFLRITVGPPGATARLQHALDEVLPTLPEATA